MNSRKPKRRVIILGILLAFIMIGVKAYYDTHTIEVKRFEIKDSPLCDALSGLKIAFLTDLHIKEMDVRENKVIEILGEEKPDLILLSGDYIRFKGSYEPLISFFHQLKATYGVYGVLGNTEYSNENGSCILCHQKNSKALKERQSPIFLRNASLVLEINGKRLHIYGVDDPVKEKSDLRKTLGGGNAKEPSILLAHSPEVFEEAAVHGIDLILCGHNHGGQISLTRHLRYVLPLDPILEYLEGFYQKGKTLMYVSRGVGTSYLPFRLGVKPEMTFFSFPNGTKEKTRIARMNQTNPGNSSHPIHPGHPVLVSNNPSHTVFAGLSSFSLLSTFNFLGVFDSLGLMAAPQRHNRVAQQHSNTAAQKILFDFESEEELKLLNWECHKWFELSEENVTSGKKSLKVLLPPGKYPGIYFQEFHKDWSKANDFRLDVFNPSEEKVTFHIRIDDHKSGWEYANRFDINFELKPGINHISIPTPSIRTNIHHRPLNLKRIERMMVFIPDNLKARELYIDHIRLE